MQTSDPCPHRLLGAQNAQLWTASVLIGIELTSAQNGRVGARESRAELITESDVEPGRHTALPTICETG